MTTLIITGNLTKDAEVKATKDGKKYVLLQVAENIYKRDVNGKIIKNADGHYETLQTMFYSVFVNDKNGALNASTLEKGKTIKVIGKARINIDKDVNGYDKYIIDRVNAYSIEVDPFNKLSESDELASDETLNDILL